jgi:hypothetical protein
MPRLLNRSNWRRMRLRLSAIRPMAKFGIKCFASNEGLDAGASTIFISKVRWFIC